MKYLARFKKSIGTFKKHGVYLFSHEELSKVPPSCYEYIRYDSIEPYKAQETLLIIRSGGIGDLCILSILCDAAPKVIVVTQRKYAPYLQLWKRIPIIKHFNEPIFTAKDTEDFIQQVSRMGRLDGEDAIIEGSTENWADIFLKAAGKETGVRRPQFRTVKRNPRKGCLIVYKSGVVDRTANPAPIVQVAQKFFESVELCEAMTTPEYIQKLMDYDYVISTDTSAIHLREGFGLPAVGIFGAVRAESRIGGYHHVIGLQSNICTPCYRHSMKPCQHNTGTDYAPCLAFVSIQLDILLQRLFEKKK